MLFNKINNNNILLVMNNNINNINNKPNIISFIEKFETNFLPNSNSNSNFNSNIIKSIIINYKTYIALLIVPYLLTSDNFISGYVITILGLFYIYFGHIFYHSPYSFIFFFIHTYHHDHNDSASVYQEIIMEFLGIMLVVLVLTVINDIKHINYIYDPYIILYYFFFYASVHFLNYTFLRINNYHYKHHKSIESNYFPDICDIIFNTKYNNNTDYIENTDHWFFNIIGSATVAYFIKKYVEKSSNHIQKNIKYSFMFIYLSLALYMFIFAGSNFFNVIRSIDCFREHKLVKIIEQLKKRYVYN